MNIQTLLESSNQYKVIADDAKKLSSKWVKSGLLEGLKGETDRNTMAMLLENQAKQLVTEALQLVLYLAQVDTEVKLGTE